MQNPTSPSATELSPQSSPKRPDSLLTWLRWFWQGIVRAMCGLAILSVLGMIGIELANVVFETDINALTPSETLRALEFVLLYFLPLYILLPTMVVTYVWLMIKTLTVSIRSIVVEKQPGTWIFPKLNRLKPYDFIMGRVLVVGQALLPYYLFFGVLRIGVMLWLAATRTRLNTTLLPDFAMARPYEWIIYYHDRFVGSLLGSSAILMGLTVLGGLLTIACGIQVAMAHENPRRWVAWLKRTGLLVLVFVISFGIGWIYSSNRDYSVINEPLYFGEERVPLTVALNVVDDNGLFTTAGFLSDAMIAEPPVFMVFVGLITTLGIYSILSGFMLWLAVREAWRCEEETYRSQNQEHQDRRLRLQQGQSPGEKSLIQRPRVTAVRIRRL